MKFPTTDRRASPPADHHPPKEVNHMSKLRQIAVHALLAGAPLLFFVIETAGRRAAP
jgi:hypothetical protein